MNKPTPETNNNLVDLRQGRGSSYLKEKQLHEQKLPNARAIANIKEIPKEENQAPQKRDLPDKNEVVFEWKALDFIKTKKTKNWYAGLIVISGGLMSFAIYSANWMFALVIAVGASTIVILNNTRPKQIKFALHNDGVFIQDRLYKYSDLKSFWILNLPGNQKELIVTSKKIAVPQLKMPLGNIDPEEIKKEISKYIPAEEDPQESTSDILARLIGL